jgi:peroxiredoxin Q/BCP
MTSLAKGDKAPAIKAKDQDGNPIQLSTFKGKKVALFFYPKDNTPGCTAEACSIRDNYKLLLKNGIQPIGVSIDDEKSHQKFISKFELPFPIIADTDKKVVSDYGVWVEKSMYGKKYMGTARVTFIIDEKGKIEHVFEKVNTKAHAEEILALL